MNPLMQIPGLAGYLAAKQQNEETGFNQIKQAAGVMSLQQALQAQELEQKRRQAVAASGGDVEKAMQALIASGDAAGAAKLAPIVEARRKAKQGQPIGAGGLRNPDGTVTPPAARPQQFAPPELVKLQEHLQSLPAGDPRRAPVEARIKILGERPSPVQLTMPASSDTMQGEDGKWYKVRIGKDGKVETIPLQTAAGAPLRPAPSAAELKAGQDAKDATSDIAEIERLGTELDTLVQQNQGLFKGVVGPQGYVGRIYELAAGAAGAGTPAIDFANKSKLFLSSVRKMVEKDSNLSNQERTNLLESIGVGFWQTGPSSIRARRDVMTYVKSKRIGGLKAPQQFSQEDLEFTAKKHGITVEEVKKRLGAR